MNVSKFVEQREAVKQQLAVDKLLASCIFAVESRVHTCTRASAHQDTRALWKLTRVLSIRTHVSLALVCQITCERYCTIIIRRRWQQNFDTDMTKSEL